MKGKYFWESWEDGKGSDNAIKEGCGALKEDIIPYKSMSQMTEWGIMRL